MCACVCVRVYVWVRVFVVCVAACVCVCVRVFARVCVAGVYVEEMGDSSTQKLYAGLLGVGG